MYLLDLEDDKTVCSTAQKSTSAFFHQTFPMWRIHLYVKTQAQTNDAITLAASGRRRETTLHRQLNTHYDE